MFSSDAASGWAGWALVHPEFEASVNTIPTTGADYAHRITASPPRFENLEASLFRHFNSFFVLKTKETPMFMFSLLRLFDVIIDDSSLLFSIMVQIRVLVLIL